MKKTMRILIIFLSVVLLASCKTQKAISDTAVTAKRSAVLLKPEAVESIKKNKAFELGKRVLEACNTSRFKAFTQSEATDKVIANATAERISATCQKIMQRNGRFIDLQLIDITHDEIKDEYLFRYDITYEKKYFKKELRVTINADNKVSAISTKEIKTKPL